MVRGRNNENKITEFQPADPDILGSKIYIIIL